MGVKTKLRNLIVVGLCTCLWLACLLQFMLHLHSSIFILWLWSTGIYASILVLIWENGIIQFNHRCYSNFFLYICSLFFHFLFNFLVLNTPCLWNTFTQMITYELLHHVIGIHASILSSFEGSKSFLQIFGILWI